MRNCDNCVYHLGGSCSRWKCEETSLEEYTKQIREKTINECLTIVTECVWKDSDMLVELIEEMKGEQ